MADSNFYQHNSISVGFARTGSNPVGVDIVLYHLFAKLSVGLREMEYIAACKWVDKE